MAIGTLPPEQDERTDSIPESEEVFSRRMRGLSEAETSAAQGSGGKDGDKTVGAQEADGDASYVNRFGEDKKRQNAMDIVDGVQLGQAARGGFIFTRRRKAGIIGLILAILIPGAGAGFFFAPALAPIMAVTNIMDDLNDNVAAMQIGSDNLFKVKTLPREQKSKALRGCTVLSRQCKLATLNARQVAKLKSVNIEVIPSTPNQGSRWAPERYRFQGVEYDAAGWSEQLKTNRAAQNAQLRANNMKYLSLRGPGFDRVLEKFNLSRRAPELRGSTQDRVNALLNKAGVPDPNNLNFTEIIDPDTGEKSFVLDGDPDGTSYTQEEVDSMKKAVDRVNAARAPSKVTKASIGALSVLGYWDMACSVSSMLGAASIAAQVATKAELIQAAIPVVTSVQRVQAGDGTPEDNEAIQRFFLDTDNRELIADLSGSVNFTNPTEPPSVSDTLATIENPDYGKNAMNSPLYQLSTSGQMQGMGQTETIFALGASQNQLLAGVDGAAKVLDDLTNLGTNRAGADTDICGIVQSGPVRILGGIASVGLAIVSFGTSTAIQAGVGVVMMGAMMILDTIINNALQSGSIVNNADLANDPRARMGVFWTGIAGAMGENSQQAGLVPTDSAGMAEYQSLKNEVDQRYIAMETEGINQLDISNQYSFLGSLTASILQNVESSPSISSALHNTSSLVRGGLASIFTSASAASIDPARFKHCNTKPLPGIEPDVQCNLRYYMPPEDLKLDPLVVADYMETSGMVAPDTTTGLPEGYTPPEARDAQNEVMSFIQGAVDSIVTTSPLPNNYARFLEYCKFRSMPYGETYEEATALGDNLDEKKWQTGEKCIERGTEVRYFRMYTLYNEIEDASSGEGTTSAFDDIDTESVASLFTPPQTETTQPTITDTSSELASLLSYMGSLFDLPQAPNSLMSTQDANSPIVARRLTGGLLV